MYIYIDFILFLGRKCLFHEKKKKIIHFQNICSAFHLLKLNHRIEFIFKARSECEKQLLVCTEEYAWLQKTLQMYTHPDTDQSKE